MLNLSASFLNDLALPVSCAWQLSACMEAKGKQELWANQKPEILAALRAQAIIQSVESSNRIEGVTVEHNRLRPLMEDDAPPQDRSEEELVGYRNALRWIFAEKDRIRVVPQTIRHLHQLAQGGHSSDAAQWKKKNNEIIELLPNGERRIRFVPSPAAQVEPLIKKLCRNYEELIQEDRVPASLLAATFVFDFLCIHPFRDGNGRVSRLLTVLLLQEQGILVGRYVSLERLIEQNKEEYYAILERCSRGWHECKNDLSPWWNYFLSILRQAYGEFSGLMEGASGTGKMELIRQRILRKTGLFTLAQLQAECPSISSQLIKKVLSELKRAGMLELQGHGRGAKWQIANH